MAQKGMYEAEVWQEGEAQSDSLEATQSMVDKKSEEQTLERKPCPRCDKLCSVKRKWVRPRLQTTAGEVSFRRHYHRCPECREGFYPLDRELQLLEKGERSPRMTQLMLDMGLCGPFEESAQRFLLHHGVSVSENAMRLVIERMGKQAEADPMLAHRLRPLAKTPREYLIASVDGSMVSTRGKDAWREVKLGLVVRGEHLVRNQNRGLITEARFVARMNSFDDFKKDFTRILSLKRAWDCPTVAFVGDGAPWVWNMADEVCANAIQILDYPHAISHAASTAQQIFPQDPNMAALWISRVKQLLWNGEAQQLIAEVEECAFGTRGALRKSLTSLARYYENNKMRMNYSGYRKKGLPCGSGCIESAHRHVLQKRMKLAGQHWEPERADRMAQLRAALATAGPQNLFHAITA